MESRDDKGGHISPERFKITNGVKPLHLVGSDAEYN